MTKLSYDEIKAQKNFYRDHYRGVVTTLIISFIVTLVLIFCVFYVHLTQSDTTFYATSGVTSPVELTPLAHPNDSASFLLPPDPSEQEPLNQK